MHETTILDGAEEFELGSGPVGALLIHGFTSSPQNMRALGEHLAAGGVAVHGVRLPGHGTKWQDLNLRRAEEWAGAVEDAFHRLAAAKDEVFVVGLSFGAALALDLAARYPDEPAGVVALAPFLFTKDPRRFFAPLIRHLTKSVPGVGNDIADPDPAQREIVYERFPTGAGHLMLAYAKRVKAELGAVRCPVLLIHSKNDHTAPPANSRVVHDAISSEDKQVVWLDRSYHVITLDVDRDRVYARTLSFIKERSRRGL